MRRDRCFLALSLPFWSIDLALRRPGVVAEKGLALTRIVHGQALVQRCCVHAHTAGVREGATLELARALHPPLQHLPFEPLEDLRKLRALALWCLRFSPLVALDPLLSQALRQRKLHEAPAEAWGIVIDLTGTARVHGGFGALVQKLHTTLNKRGLISRIAVAPTVGAAWALSRYAPALTTVADSSWHTRESLRDLLASLPVEALRIEAKVAHALRQLGITTIGILLNLPHRELLQRFGHALLMRIDQALGSSEEPLRTIRAPSPFMVQRLFETPLTSHDTLCRVLIELFHRLLQQLAARHSQAGRFLIVLRGRNADYSPVQLRSEISLLSATNRSALTSILQPVIERVQMPQGVHSITLYARALQRATSDQAELTSNEIALDSQQRENLLNSFATRLGRDRIAVSRFHESYIPERSYSFVPLHSHASPVTLPPVVYDRPTHILSEPEEIQAISLLPDKPPTLITWRGTAHKIVRGAGPERIAREWWREPIGAEEGHRDYFKVQDEAGRWLWVFREQGTMRWYLHGVWG